MVIDRKGSNEAFMSGRLTPSAYNVTPEETSAALRQSQDKLHLGINKIF